MTLKIDVRTPNGKKDGAVELPAALFDVEPAARNLGGVEGVSHSVAAPCRTISHEDAGIAVIPADPRFGPNLTHVIAESVRGVAIHFL